MSNEAAIRRRNLRSLKKGPRELADSTGKTYSYYRDLLEDDNKSFGERAARAIEEGLGLPHGWLDTIHLQGSSATQTAHSGTGAVTARPPASIVPRKLTDRLARLDELQRQAVLQAWEATLDIAIVAVKPPSSSRAAERRPRNLVETKDFAGKAPAHGQGEEDDSNGPRPPRHGVPGG